jgi:hypothetical protein
VASACGRSTRSLDGAVNAPQFNTYIRIRRSRKAIVLQLLLAPLVGWLSFRRTDLIGILVTALLGGALLWFFLTSPPIVAFSRSRSLLIQWLGVVVAVAGVVVSLKYAIPYALDALAPPNPSLERP